MGTEQVMSPKTCKTYDDDKEDDADICHLNVCVYSLIVTESELLNTQIQEHGE